MVVSRLLATPADKREIQWLAELVEVGVQLELATIPPYLTAYWSIKDRSHAVARSLFEIVMEEMQHLGVMCNLLAGLGHQVELRRAALVYPCRLPGGVHPNLILDLLPLGRDSLESFMAIEYPETGDDVAPPDGDAVATIGDFYSMLEEGFTRLAPTLNTTRQVEGLGLKPLAGVGDVLRALEIIKRQGEGSQYSPADSSVRDLSHYYRFREMRDGRRFRYDTQAAQWQWAESIDIPRGEGVWPLSYSGSDDAEGPEARSALDNFDKAYTGLLCQLEQAWQRRDARCLAVSAGMMSRLGETATAVMRIARADTPGTCAPRFRIRNTGAGA